MSTATKATRQISFGSLLQTIFMTQTRTTLTSRKAIALICVNLLPIVGAVFYLLSDGKSGLDIYKGLVEFVVFTLLLPLTCLFNGGPAVVEEIEGRTITYLFLRPVSKPAIFLGKMFSAVVSSVLLVIVPMIPLFFICMAAGGSVDESLKLFFQTLVSGTVGCVAYTAFFAALGALFARSLLAGILYWAVVEWGMSFVPILEFATLKFHLRNAGNLIDAGHMGMLDKMVLGDNPVVVPIWASFAVLLGLATLVTAVGAWVFNDRQYLV